MHLSNENWPRTGNINLVKNNHATEWPKFSIITPSFNHGKFIEDTILSVLKQDYSNFEYIIIDGGSTDCTVDIIKRYETFVTYWVSEKDAGTFDANNKGLKLITGDYWCILNSDDYFLPDALLQVAERIRKHPRENWICGGEIVIDEKNQIITKRFPKRPKPVEGFTFLNGCWISHPTVFLKNDIVNTVGYFTNTHMMDTDYWLKMEKAGFSPYILEHYLAAYRIHKDAKSVSKIKIQNEFIKVYKNFATQNHIEKNKVVKSKLNDHIIELHIYEIWKKLVEKQRLSATIIALKILVKKPSTLFSHWYFGLLKRLITGISKNDPIYKMYENFENKANWNS